MFMKTISWWKSSTLRPARSALGEKGELVFTSITKEAFPLIRYRTQELDRLRPGALQMRQDV